jgi:type IV secretory pathway ATPase VirB11/archaellum biosynthesis ATPase|tara:strand:+ start:2779 stop:5097 length:2319 start_codon:yes stop_codon:yes gene_type:complete
MLLNESGNMAFLDKKLGPGDYEIVEEGNQQILKVNYLGVSFQPSIEHSKLCMNDIVDKLIQVPSINRIVLSSDRNYMYDENQTQILREVANLYVYLTRQKKILSNLQGLSIDYLSRNPSKLATIQYIVSNLLKSDPIGAYVELRRIIREEKINIKKIKHPLEIKETNIYLKGLIDFLNLLDNLTIIKLTRESLDGYIVGERSIYSTIFKPIISPNFMLTRLMVQIPLEAHEEESYNPDEETNVTIYSLDNDVKNYYHLMPPEFNLDDDKIELLDLARNILAEHKPEEKEFTDPDRMRKTFFNIGRDLLLELAQHQNMDLDFNEANNLAKILVRYTVGFGLLEVLLKDDKIQDIVINGPIGQTSIFIVHQDYGECVTNIVPSATDGESWATRFRMISGRPLDQANPILDTELIVPGGRARVAIIGNPLNPLGLGYALRRHRDDPWTLPLFIHNKTINPLGAGLLSFLIDGSRSVLVAGTRSSGKTSLLGSFLVEIMRKFRIITVEDTLELPVDSLRELGYNVQPMKVRAALSEGGTELAAEEGIRTSLRLGDSSLILGEVRSKEALALYEAMRVGALANVVAGTIHGGSPYAVYDRVVNDLGVPRTSFKATDIIVVVNPIKTPDGLHKIRRVISITEVRKHWEKDPLREGGFIELMKYNPESDQLEPTDNLINGDSEVIKDIASNVKEWAGNWDAIWENILLRADIKKNLVEYAEKIDNFKLLESKFIVKSNDAFHRISDNVLVKEKVLDSKKILFKWNEWLKKEAKNYAKDT